MTKTRILISGDSHTGPLAMGLAQWRGREDLTALDLRIQALGSGHLLPGPFFEDRGDHVEIVQAEYKDRCPRLPPLPAHFDWIGFSGPLHSMRLWSKDWTRHKPIGLPVGDEPDDPALHRVSIGLIQQIIDDDVAQQLAMLSALRRHHRVFVMEAPAPFRAHPAVNRNGASTVLCLNQLYRARVTQQLEARDIPVVSMEPDWLTPEGFLRPRFKSTAAGDHHHGNADFGEAMLKRMAQVLGLRTSTPSP
ncbi:hypothetical protein KGA65_17265 [Ideonella sp. B7]|uniref:hypothetical protein n=1 Tax=Ideonella benzenivorans TaxID=2831643 RepID=UPI001CEC4466|nr:hypothetical protein [Ideonella benzenivorans]MCA6218287.1 hypothetical protein [Ideonella benzenivorans]